MLLLNFKLWLLHHTILERISKDCFAWLAHTCECLCARVQRYNISNTWAVDSTNHVGGTHTTPLRTHGHLVLGGWAPTQSITVLCTSSSGLQESAQGRLTSPWLCTSLHLGTKKGQEQSACIGMQCHNYYTNITQNSESAPMGTP